MRNYKKGSQALAHQESRRAQQAIRNAGLSDYKINQEEARQTKQKEYDEAKAQVSFLEDKAEKAKRLAAYAAYQVSEAVAGLLKLGEEGLNSDSDSDSNGNSIGGNHSSKSAVRRSRARSSRLHKQQYTEPHSS